MTNRPDPTEPLSLETVLEEFSSDYEAWVLRDARSGLYVNIPHPKYPKRIIIHFFMSRENALTVLASIAEADNKVIGDAPIIPVKVKLHEAIRSIAATKKKGFADGFVVHSPNEVFEAFFQS